MTSDLHAHRASASPPANDEGPTVAAVAPQESKRNESPDSDGAGLADQGALTMAGERWARFCLARLQGGIARPGELAAVLVYLRCELVHRFCRAIEKALEGRHHA